MPFKFLEDIAIADIAFEVEAKDLPQLFKDAAAAFLAIQVNNPGKVKAVEYSKIGLANREIDILLYKFLQELVYLKDVKSLLLRVKAIDVRQSSEGFSLDAKMEGETLDPKRHDQRADVKAVTFHCLEVKKTGAGYHATVIVDV